MPQGSLKKTVLRETALFLALLFAGLVLLPIAIYWIGPYALGEYGGHEFAEFFRSLGARIRNGEVAAWFLVLLATGISWALHRPPHQPTVELLPVGDGAAVVVSAGGEIDGRAR